MYELLRQTKSNLAFLRNQSLGLDLMVSNCFTVMQEAGYNIKPTENHTFYKLNLN
jgi:hypothetical protein